MSFDTAFCTLLTSGHADDSHNSNNDNDGLGLMLMG